MEEKRSGWQQIKTHPVATQVVAIVLVVGIAFIISAYRFGWSGTGFLNKSLWDWLQLLIIPLALAVIALVFQLANARTERQIAKERYEQDQQIALDKQHEDLLQAYLDRMSELLLNEKLRSSEVDADVRNVARVRTITVLTQLNAGRIGYVFAFLREAGLMSTTSNDNAVSLGGADLHAVNWSSANLNNVNLSHASLHNANLRKAILSHANLAEAYLMGADLRGAFLEDADLSHANLEIADLRLAFLKGTDLSHANLPHALLSTAFLNGADLNLADLSYADLREAEMNNANLNGADLSLADLRRVKVTYEQLDQAKSLKGAIMPDGKMHHNSSGADLRWAHLSGFDLSGVDLSGANLRYASVTQKQLETVKSLKGATMPDGSIHP